MAFSQKIRDFIHNAWADDHVCLVGTVGADGPNISPKGSMIVFDDEHLAYWERSKRKALDNLKQDPRVVVVYSNMKAFREKTLQSAVLRFYGTATVHESGPVKDAIFAKASAARADARRRGSGLRRADQADPRRGPARPAARIGACAQPRSASDAPRSLRRLPRDADRQ